jgi:ferric-dicitrate binding protein FerR (iron transport regulator)
MQITPAMNAKILQQAAHWLIELEIALETPEGLTKELWRSFEEWLSLTPHHRETYLQIERSWHEATQLGRALRADRRRL